jgi:hypothetical protein
MAGAPEVLAEVGTSYLDAHSDPHDLAVLAAYEQLQAETDQLFEGLLGASGSTGVRAAFTRCRQPYASDLELIDAVRATKVLEITTAAVNSEPIHPVLECSYAGAFDRFRAVHDLVGHVWAGFGFDLADEVAAWRVQDRLHSDLAKQALATELLGVNSARSILGEAPAQKAILLQPERVQRARAMTEARRH